MKKYSHFLGLYKFYIPIIHFFMTFVWERRIFIFENGYKELLSVPRSGPQVSDKFEWIVVYISTKIVSALMIYVIWKLIFFICDKKISKKNLTIFSILYLIGVFLLLIEFPNSFGIEMDNYTNYLMATRFIPTYWQNVFTGIYYASCLMLFPNPISIQLVQWTAFVYTLGYLVYKSEKNENIVHAYAILLILFMPETYYVAINPYRGNLYTILIVLYIGFIYYELYVEEAVVTVKKCFIFAFLTVLIIVWRGEGKIFGVAGLLLFVITIIRRKENKKLIISFFACLMILYLAGNSLQNLGAKKYYGNDYMILNTAEVLRNILNDDDANLDYIGAGDDLNAIEKVIPIQVLKEAGQTGYRNYNWTKGNADFNQTLASDENATNYMSAYYHIISHNIGDYLDTQINCLYRCFRINPANEEHYFEGESELSLEPFQYTQWEEGKTQLLNSGFVSRWESSSRRHFFYDVEQRIITTWRGLLQGCGISTIVNVILFMILITLFMHDMLYIKRDGIKQSLFFVVMSFFLLGQFAGIVLFMPEGRPQYMYPIIYGTICLAYLKYFEFKLLNTKIS